MGSDETSTSLLRRIGRRVGRRIGEELAMPPRRCEERYRHELKYLISYGQKADLNVRMAPLLDHDSHARDGSYTIRSLYFDDYWNTAYQEKVDGVLTRKKYRIRIYDYSDRVIKLDASAKATVGSTRRTRRSRTSSSTGYWPATSDSWNTASINCAGNSTWNT